MSITTYLKQILQGRGPSLTEPRNRVRVPIHRINQQLLSNPSAYTAPNSTNCRLEPLADHPVISGIAKAIHQQGDLAIPDLNPKNQREFEKRFKRYSAKAVPWSETESVFGGLQIGITELGVPFLVSGLVPFAIAIASGSETVDAEVTVRHPEWQRFRNELVEFAELSLDEETRIKDDLSHYGGRLYQQAYHFDTADIPYSWGRDRAQYIGNSISKDARTLLDIGCNYGLMCSELEKQGLECTGIELKKADFKLLERLRAFTDGKFRAENCSIFDFKSGQSLKYDVVLALFIFHHFVKTPELLEELIKLLKRLDCTELYLGVPDPEEQQMQDAYRNLNPVEFAELVMKHTGLSDHETVECPDLGARTILRIF